MADKVKTPDIKTLTITNFKGALSPKAHGDLNSGFSPWGSGENGYNSLWNNFKGEVLDFFEAPTDITGGILSGTYPTVLHFAQTQNSMSQSGNQVFIYGVDANAQLYEIRTVNYSSGWQPDYDTITKFGSSIGTAPTMYYGGGILASAKYNDTQSSANWGLPELYVAYDEGIAKTTGTSIVPATPAWTQLTWTDGSNPYIKSIPHPMVEFLAAGGLLIANGNNLAYCSDGITVTNGAKLNPGFPKNYLIRDLAVSPDGTYLAVLATDLQGAPLLFDVRPTAGTNLVYPPNSIVALWNGADLSVSSTQFFKGVNLACVGVSNTKMILVGTDDEGLGIWDLSGNKLAELPNYSSTSAFRPPLSQTIQSVGDKFFFQVDVGNGSVQVFCFDSADNSLYPLAIVSYTTSPIVGGVAIPVLRMNIDASSVFSDIGRTKIYYSVGSKLYSLHLQSVYGGSTGVTGVGWSSMYEKLPRKAEIKEVRVYLCNTAGGVSFEVALNTLLNAPSNNSYTYTYSAADGVKDVVKWTPKMKPIKEIGVQIVNLGTVNPLIQKVEIDYEEVFDVPVL